MASFSLIKYTSRPPRRRTTDLVLLGLVELCVSQLVVREPPSLVGKLSLTYKSSEFEFSTHKLFIFIHEQWDFFLIL